MARRRPDALFVRDPEAEQAQDLPLVGTLYLLTRTSNPRLLARSLAGQLTDPDNLPARGAVVPLWIDVADAWDCDVPAQNAARMRLSGCTVVGISLMWDGDDASGVLLDVERDARGFIYEVLPLDVATDAATLLHDALAPG